MKRVFIILAIVVMCVVGGFAVSSVYGPQPPEENNIANNEDSDVKGDKVSKAIYRKITPEEVKNMQTKKESFVLVDVRTQEEFDEGHISGATLVPSDEITEAANEKFPDKDAKIVVYCRSGGRSQMVANQMIEMGYKNVYDLGGIIDWPYDVVVK